MSALFSGGIWLSSFSSDFAKQNIRIGLVTDSHYAEADPKGTRFYRESLEKMEEFISEMNREKVDFIIHLGDFKDQDEQQREEDTLRFLKDLEQVYAGFQGPRYHCLGNHDVDSIRKKQFLQNIDNTGIAKGKSYYSFDHKGVHFVVLDANYHKDGRDHFYKEGANWQDANIPEVEMEWLKQDLSETTLPAIVFCHHPLFEYWHGESQMHVRNYGEVQKIMQASGKVMAAFHGHVHEEKFTALEGIHYITQYAMVDGSGAENSSFSIIEISGEEIQVLGYKRATSKKFIE